MILRMSSAVTNPRSIALDPNEQRVIEEARVRRLQRLAKRELWSLVAFTTAFAAAATAMALFIPSERSPGIVATLVLIGAYAAAFRLEFEISSGTAVPTELILVPMLFVLPTGQVPLAVAAGVLLASLLECLRGTLHLDRLVLRLLNASHAIGPALVLGLAGESQPQLGHWPLYLAALAAQFALDFAVTAAGETQRWSVDPGGARPPIDVTVCIPAGGHADIRLRSRGAARLRHGRTVSLHLERLMVSRPWPCVAS